MSSTFDVSRSEATRPNADPKSHIPVASASKERPRVVIVGGGFGGLYTAKGLAHAPVDVVVIDRRNHHLFQPLLYQVATAGLSPAQIAAPIRHILRDQKNTSVLMEEVTGVDVERREVVMGERRLGYDYLVLATGARHSYFGHDEWEPFAPGLKSIEDATEIRRRVLLAFERAEAETDEAERARLLRFIIIGGGPTGVELAGKVIEIARLALRNEFRHIDPAAARVLLVEAGPRLLAAFPSDLSNDAERRLARLGVEVLLGKPVTACSAEGAVIGGTEIPSRTILWAAGVAASPAARWIGTKADRAGRAIVDSNLRPEGHDDIYVIGDTASAKSTDGKAVPGLAAAAKQEGKYVAKAIVARVAGGTPQSPFAYTNFGNLATIGRFAAVIEFGKLHLTGFVAWLLWSMAHIFFLVGHRNRLAAILDWAWNWLTFEQTSRLITNEHRAPTKTQMPE
jgi:NADH dehydrogenase